MGTEYHSVQFNTDTAGIASKNAYSKQMTDSGWWIASETIEQGHMKGRQACCGAMICLPFVFLAGRTPGVITVTFARSSGTNPGTAISKVLRCGNCGTAGEEGDSFCIRCGNRIL